MRIVFMGTPDFAAASLDKLLQEKMNVVGVFTQPDKPRGRGMATTCSPVKELALSAGLPVFQPEKMRDGTALQTLKELHPDLLVVVAYGRILPDEILALPPYGAINVHGSLLPKYRGAAPIQWSVLNGDTITGVSTMYLASEMDAGDIIYTRETEIGEKETSGQLFDRLMVMGADLLVETIRAIEAGKAPKKSRVYVLGLTFKENCPDLRNSKVYDIIKRLQEYSIDVVVTDPWGNPGEAKRLYGVDLIPFEEVKDADCIIVAVGHNEYRSLSMMELKKLFKESPDDEKVLIDVKSVYRMDELKASGMRFWRL